MRVKLILILFYPVYRLLLLEDEYIGVEIKEKKILWRKQNCKYIGQNEGEWLDGDDYFKDD